MNNHYTQQMKKLLSPQEYEKLKKEQFSLRQRRARHPPPEYKSGDIESSSKKTSKKLQSPQSNQQKEKLSLYDFSATVFVNQVQELNYVKQHKDGLQKLLQVVLANKGIIEVVGTNYWQKIYETCRQKFKDSEKMSEDELFRIYLKYIIQYQFYLKNETLNIKKNVDITNTLSRPLFIRGRLKQIMRNSVRGIDMYKNQIVVFPKGIQELQIKYSDINLDLIRRQCGQQKIQVRIQRPLDYGFNIYKMANIPHKLTINEYCAYQQNVKNQQYKIQKFKQLLSHNKVFFGVNFEPSNLQIFSQLWKHFQGNFLGYRQQFDLLSYLDSDIPGCSSPQFYLKVQGCWTGGHQQNVNMCAVNVNHGPDASEWYTMPYSQVQNLRALLLEKFKIDLYRDQGLWFEKINWFIEQGFPIKRILQQKGDIVISGPGTLHWVRSYGIALQSAWNVFPKTLQSINVSVHRHRQNQLLGLQKSGTIPLRSLFIKYLDHELQTMDRFILEAVLQKVNSWKSEDQEQRISLHQVEGGYYCSKNSVQYVRLSDLQALCCKCKHEIFNYYVLNWAEDGILCMSCFKKAKNKPLPISFVLHSRYPNEELAILLDNANLRHYMKKSDFRPSLCFGNHIGPVKCNRRQPGQKGRTPFSRCVEFCSYKNDLAKQFLKQNRRKQDEQQPIKKVFVLNQKNNTEEGEVGCSALRQFNQDRKDQNSFTPYKQYEKAEETSTKDQVNSRSRDKNPDRSYNKKSEQNHYYSEKNQGQNQKQYNQSRNGRHERDSSKNSENYPRRERNEHNQRSRDQKPYRNNQKNNQSERDNKSRGDYDKHRSNGKTGNAYQQQKDYNSRRYERQRDYRKSSREHQNHKSDRQGSNNRDYRREQYTGRDRYNQPNKDYSNYDNTTSSRYEKEKYSSETKKLDETIDY